MTNQIVPAILTNDIDELKSKLESVANLVDWVQVDIMDGKFVDNKSISLRELAEVETKLNISVHLMVLSPQDYLVNCQRAKVKRVLVHAKACESCNDVLEQIGDLGMESGMAIKTDTPVESIRPYLDRIDVALILSVNPGFGGQKFIPENLEKIKQLRELAPNLDIVVDGGITKDNITKIKEAGANIFVVGSSIFKHDDIKMAIAELNNKIK